MSIEKMREQGSNMTIREMRERTGMTQQEFGDLLNIPKRSIENWEGNKTKCPDYVRELIQYTLFCENLIMNSKITFTYTDDYDENVPNNNFPEETEDIVVAKGEYDFEDYLRDNGVNFEEDEKCEGFYWVLDEFNERTNQAYMIIKTENTYEDLCY